MTPQEIAILILPLWLRHEADEIDRKVDRVVDSDSLRSAAEEIERLRHFVGDGEEWT